jgi:hypothetical protein
MLYPVSDCYARVNHRASGVLCPGGRPQPCHDLSAHRAAGPAGVEPSTRHSIAHVPSLPTCQAFRNRRAQEANPFAVIPSSTSSASETTSLDSGLAISTKLQQARIDRQRLKAVRVLGKKQPLWPARQLL